MTFAPEHCLEIERINPARPAGLRIPLHRPPDPRSTVFAAELARWGPTATDRPISLAEADAYCARLAATHYENFPVVSCFLPRPLRPHFRRIYAYCRWADDLADEVGTAEDSLSLLAWWRDELRACYAGEVRHPVFVALRPTVMEFQIPILPFEDLLSAFEQDQRIYQYETFEQLRDYCRRSADPVGRLVLALFERATPENFAWSDSLCTGLQLANFWQDVARDKDIGRVYLPREDRLRCGYADEELHGRVTNDAFIELMRCEVARARRFFSPWRDPARPELAGFPFRFRLAIDLFSRGGLRILDRIEQIEFRVWDARPKLSKWDVARMMLVGWWQTRMRDEG